MNDRQSQEDTQALAQILEGDQHHYHHQLKAPDFSHHHKSDNDGHRHDVHALDLPVGGDDDDMHTGGEEELDLALGDIGTPDMDASGRTNSFGRPPSIRKGELDSIASWYIPWSSTG
jgi:hypothetical protein